MKEALLVDHSMCAYGDVGYLRVPLKGYYKATVRVPLKGSTRV